METGEACVSTWFTAGSCILLTFCGFGGETAGGEGILVGRALLPPEELLEAVTVAGAGPALAPFNALLLQLLLELSFGGCEGGVGGLGLAGTPTGSECCGWLL